MSDVAKGSQRVGSMMSTLAKHGYRCARISASGQRKGKRRNEKGIDGDIIALAPEGMPHLLIEVGGKSKSVKQSISEMLEHPLPPGFVPIVARCIGKGRNAWRYHARAYADGHTSLLAAIDEARVA